MKLYELTAEYKALELLGESDEIPAETIRNTLDGLTGDIEEKCKAVAMYIRNLISSADAIERAAEAMHDRQSAIRRRAESLHSYLQLNMQACGITRIDCPYFTLQLKKNPPAVIVDDETLVPEKYWVQPETPPKRIDKNAIAADIKAGQAVDGCRRESGERLEIKV